MGKIIAVITISLIPFLYLFTQIQVMGSFTYAFGNISGFIGATFLHTLCSALIGYFLAISFKKTKKRIWFLLTGILLATLLHGLYDFSIMTIDGPLKIIIPAAILMLLAVFIISGFEKLKKVKSVCEVIITEEKVLNLKIYGK